ncbi:hypothetical protein CLF_107571 [Clonorchis sinensis]|uniref:Uncharacterized protein n=1 Tax=Clonorchis sinensis TaxID=79923 RepID=G7YQT9_CLOSI|nr:hypothetical protein CLF_107571 [Clonorchis sinensis]
MSRRTECPKNTFIVKVLQRKLRSYGLQAGLKTRLSFKLKIGYRATGQVLLRRLLKGDFLSIFAEKCDLGGCFVTSHGETIIPHTKNSAQKKTCLTMIIGHCMCGAVILTKLKCGHVRIQRYRLEHVLYQNVQRQHIRSLSGLRISFFQLICMTDPRFRTHVNIKIPFPIRRVILP